MAPAGHHPPKPPDAIKGFKVGDRVITPLGRHAVVTALRNDGYVDVEYSGWFSRDGSVPVRPELLRREV